MLFKSLGLGAAVTVAVLGINDRSAMPTAREVAEHYIAARGGMDRIMAVHNLVFRGPPRPNGKPGRFMARARPNYYLVGEPTPSRDFAEGSDGASWEFYADPGLVIRTSDAPAMASRHTAYFDDPLINVLQFGWKAEVLGTDAIGGHPAYQVRITYPDGFQTDEFVDKQTWLLTAVRKTAKIHAFGDAISTETRVTDYRSVNGVLFPTKFDEFVIATNQPAADLSGGWATIEANVPLPLDYFSPPPEPQTPLARTLNAIYAARSIAIDAMAWYRNFRADSSTSAIDTEAGMEAVGYQCLKNGAVNTGVQLLEANLRDYPLSPAAHFGLGRAYRTAGRERDAIIEFRQALAIDPKYQRALDALAASVPKH